MRKLRRAVAKTSMRNKGMVQFCKKVRTRNGQAAVGSYFSEHWREYV